MIVRKNCPLSKGLYSWFSRDVIKIKKNLKYMSYKAVSNMVGGYKCHNLSQKVLTMFCFKCVTQFVTLFQISCENRHN